MRKVRLDGKKIKALREGRDRDATQKEFAHEVGVSERQLRTIENLNRPIASDVAERIATALRQPMDALLLQTDSSPVLTEGATARAENLPKHHTEPEAVDDLIALGPNIVLRGELATVGQTEWLIEAKDFVIGEVGAVIAYIDAFGATAPADRYVLVNRLGDGRILSDAPTLSKSANGHTILCPVASRFPRTDARSLGGQWAISPKTGDLFLDKGRIARVSGVDALAQVVRQCLSLQRGEAMFQRDYGTRLGEYFAAFRDSPWLRDLLKLEVIRQAAIPYHDARNKEHTPLHCVERVFAFEVLGERTENQRLPVRVDFDVSGLGRWRHELSICVPDATTLETIRDRQEVFAAIQSGAMVGRDALSSVTAVTHSRAVMKRR